ncbi:type I phosphodiesterase/nucleotide pyrophosphatase [Gemmatirosa kalamazoonensis]|uniref:Type I phosphodiesterase/nucleotide pyrophosphatase n=1 Tax=Gemmatirosa kalamazoonensis TaxID=861299 RepID=W0RF50_9BACT|nr:alkaline phosphatase family protein [Gemmatirosa kalamazoonensis]AHG88965.1 type I phosphodiesterase/nucleotide pyrophosphatase [Gemmatirosa kalamazoonensis]
MRHRLLAAALGVALGAAPLGAQRPTQRPTLVVFFTIDQGTPVYFTRFGSQLTGGLKRLWDGGAVFTDANQDHGTTETAPGHASVMSGRFPSHTGIVRNNAGVQDPQAPVIGAPKADPVSPFRFRGTVLTDWMRTADPRTRALSVSRKDRGAILPMGRAHQTVLWYGGNGTFTTSTYYADTLPTWVRQFNARGGGPLKRFAGQTWDLLLPASQYGEPDSVALENGGKAYTFPHVFPTDSAAEAGELTNYPWMDQLTLDLALEGLQQLKLGTGPAPDVLAVSLSTTDAVGHRYGMDSREMHDHILRLDRALGAFLDSLYKLRDSSRVIIALTADHGMAPYPELHFAANPSQGRADVAPVLQRVKQALDDRHVPRDAFDFESGVVLLDKPAVTRAGVNADSVVRALVADLSKVKGVMRVYRREELASLASRDKYARRWLHMTPDDLDAVAYVTLEPYVYYAQTQYATHGSPHDYDTRVSLIFYGPPFKPGKYGAFVRTVDIAPTLAAVLGVPPTEPIDGVVLRAALK